LYCIDRFTFPKYKTHIYIRTNNNTDQTKEVLYRWARLSQKKYASISIFDANVPEKVEKFAQHEWNAQRFSVLGRIRQASIQFALERKCHYFVIDCDNFVLDPNCISFLLGSNLPVVGPMLIRDGTRYSNYHTKAAKDGSYVECPEYHLMWEQKITGFLQVDVIHCTYLIRHEVLPEISYNDGSGRYEYQIFSDVLRKKGIPQYLDNQKCSNGIRSYAGFLTFMENAEDLETKDSLYMEAVRSLPVNALLLYKHLITTPAIPSAPTHVIKSTPKSRPNQKKSTKSGTELAVEGSSH
jgi:hypothetical protein